LLIKTEINLNKARKVCCENQMSVSNLAELSHCFDETTRILSSSKQSSQLVPNINETLLIFDVIAQLQKFGLEGRYSGHNGIAHMIAISNDNNLSDEDKWLAIVKEAKHRHSSLVGLGHSAEEALLYRALAEKDSNLRFNN